MIIIDYSYPPNLNRRYEFDTDSIMVGRSSPSQMVDLDLSPDSTVSRQHACLSYENDAYWLEDKGSRYGTWINGQKISVKTRLMPGDKVKMGRTMLEMLIPEDGILTGNVSAAISPSDLLLAQEPDLASFKAIRSRLVAFYELGIALGTMEAVEPLLKTVVEYLCKAIPDAQRGALLLQGAPDLSLKTYFPEQAKPSVSLNLAKLAIEKREAFTWRRGAPGATGTLFDSVIQHGTQGAMYAPLVWKDEVLGVVFVDNFERKEAFSDDDLRLLMAMANQAAMFVKNHALQQDLRHQEVIRSNLLRQFSPQVAERLEGMLREGDYLRLGGERAEPVTILSSDVRGFTALSAQMEPHEVVGMLNELFSVCIPIIFKYKGTVDKYVGDAVLAVFGSPDPDDHQWENAVWAALEMQEAIADLGEDRASRGLPVCQVGVGIHTGAVLHGFIGSEEHMEYTVIGDAVNRATRYCDGAGPAEVVISESVFEHVSDMVEVEPKTIKSKHPETEADLEAYLVKGSQKPVD
jgi:adenylate cyclase